LRQSGYQVEHLRALEPRYFRNRPPASWTAENLRPYIEHVISSFGWDRVVWGSDWPVCTLANGLSTWVAATQAVLSGTAETERSKLLHANAQRLWKL
jgi:predicted TIM-barrel fold metal-dependent hydrolase